MDQNNQNNQNTTNSSDNLYTSYGENANNTNTVNPGYSTDSSYGYNQQYTTDPYYRANPNNKNAWETKWNWGALMLGPLFAVGNRAYLALITLVPVFNFFWIFWAGVNAESWALKNNDYRDEIEFRKIMDTWNRAGVLWAIITFAGIPILFIFLAILAVAAGV